MDIETNPFNKALFQRIITGMIAEDPGKVENLAKLFRTYDGDGRLLSIFLDKFHDPKYPTNPFRAAANATLTRAVFRTKDEFEKERVYLAVGESGHKLRDQMFVLTNPENGLVWRSGAQAITKIMETFGNRDQQDAFSATGREKTQATKRKQGKRTIKEITKTLDDVLADPAKLSGVEKHVDRAKVHAILGLDDEIKKRMRYLDRLVNGDTAFTDTDGTPQLNLVAGDPGGQLMGWYKRTLADVPMEIRDIYTTIASPYVLIREEDRSWMMGALLAYAARKMPINRVAAIGGYQKDLTTVLQLKDDDPIIQKYGRPNLLPLRSILEANEITLLDATRIFEAYPIDQVRVEMNQRYEERFKSEVESILATLKFLFMNVDGKWHEDSIGTSLPLDRIKQTKYFVALQREDFKPIRDLLRVDTLVTDTGDRYKALHSEQFKALIDGAVKAKRRIKQLDERLGAIPVGTEDEIREAKKIWTKEFCRSTEFELIENYVPLYHISFEEYVKRHQAIRGDLPRQYTEVHASGLFNIVASRQPAFLELLRDEVVVLTPEIAARRETVKQVKLSRLIRSAFHYVSDSKDYIRKTEVESIEKIFRVQETVAALEQQYGDTIARFFQLQETHLHRSILTGSIHDRIELQKTYYDGKSEPEIEVDGMKIVDASRLESRITELQDLVQSTSIPKHWLNTFQYLVSERATGALARIGLQSSSPAIAQLTPNSYTYPVYVAKSLMQAVDVVVKRIQETLALPPAVFKLGLHEYQSSSLDAKFEVRVTGTTMADGQNRFRSQVPGFDHIRNRGYWQSREPLYKADVAYAAERIQQYNEKFGTHLKLSVKRMGL